MLDAYNVTLSLYSNQNILMRFNDHEGSYNLRPSDLVAVLKDHQKPCPLCRDLLDVLELPLDLTCIAAISSDLPTQSLSRPLEVRQTHTPNM